MKKILIKLLMIFMFLIATVFFGACIEDGPPLPLEIVPDAMVQTSTDALPPVAPDAYEPLPNVDAADVTLDAAPSPVDALMFMSDAYEPPPTVDAAPTVPDANIPPDATLSVPDAILPLSVDASKSDAALLPPVDASGSKPDGTSCALPVDAVTAPVVCHGLRVRFQTDDVARMHHCTGWYADGSATLLPPGSGIIGADGVCAITCNKGESGETIVPAQCSGVWLPGATSDVSRWYTEGCMRLPDHPPSEPDQAGCAWDQRCDLY